MKIFTLFLLGLFIHQAATAAIAPTVPSSNLTFNNVDGQGMSGSFTVGNGTIRLIVMKAGSPVTGVPVNGVDYTASTTFGAANAAFTAPGEYVIGRTSFQSLSVSGLVPGTVYHVAIFEFNGTGVNTQYLQLPLTGTQSTAVAPTLQASAITAAVRTGNTITLNWTAGNGTGRMVVARKGSAVNAAPVDLTVYYPNDIFGSGTRLGTDNFLVYKGTANTVQVKNLEPNITYHFEIFEFNGTSYSMFLRPGVTFSATTNAGPTTSSTSPGYSFIEGNSFRFGVSQGNGLKRLFIARKGSAVTSSPVNGTIYTANAAFGTAGTQLAPGEFVVGAGTANAITVTNLEPNSVYHFRVFDYDEDAAGNTYYLTSSFLSSNGGTSTTPTEIPTLVQIVTLTGNTATIKFTGGNGSYNHVMMKAGSPVDAVPVNLIRYTGNSAFGNGSQVTPGNYTMFSGINGTQFTVSNLVPGVTYHVSIYEFNGSDNPVYSEQGAVFNFTVPLQPTVAAKDPWNTNVEGASFRQLWTVGNGAKRIVIARKSAAVTAVPTDGVIYTANNDFGSGQAITPDEFVVYIGTSNYVDLNNLEKATAYHLAVFEFNESPGGIPDYLASPYLATSTSTKAAPATQSIITSISALQAISATINFTAGSGNGRLVVARKDLPVNINPTDLVKYNAAQNYGNPGSAMGDGNHVIATAGGGSSVNISGLQPNTTYHLAFFEYNGNAQPVYQAINPSRHSFTTPDVAGATTPTIAATNAVVQDVDGNKLTLKWTSGNGTRRLIVMRKNSPVTFEPAAAANYTPATAFGTSVNLGDDQFAIYANGGTTVDITNLEHSTVYHFAIFEYNGTGTLTRYLTASKLTGTAATSAAPASGPTNIQAVPGATSLQLAWTNGNGRARIVVVKEGSIVTARPSNLGVYPANAVFGSGSQIALGEYVTYAATGNSVTITGLTEGRTYHYAIFEMNGTDAPVYNTILFATGSAVTSTPLPVSLLFFNAAATGNDVVLNWATATEENNAGFTIERSTDGTNYHQLATVNGAGNSNSEKRYQYTDLNAPASNLYYRLKQTDVDGRFTYSGIQRVSRSTFLKTVNIYPNPTRDKFTVALPGGTNTGTMSLYDVKGKQVLNVSVTNGQYIQTLSLARGTYYVRIVTRDNTYSATLVKE